VGVEGEGRVWVRVDVGRTEVTVDGERGTVPRWRLRWRSGRVRDISQQSIASNRRFQNHEMEDDRWWSVPAGSLPVPACVRDGRSESE